MGVSSLVTFLLPVPKMPCSVGLEVLFPQGKTLPLGDTTIIPLNWRLRLPSSCFGFLMPLNQQAKKEVTVLAGVIGPDDQGETGLPIQLKVRRILPKILEFP